MKNRTTGRTRNGGFTLVELIVAMAVLGIISTGVATLLEPSMRIFTESTNLSRSRRIADDVSELVMSEMLYASDLQFKETWAGTDEVTGNKTVRYTSPVYGTMELRQDNGTVLLVQPSSSKALGFGTDYFMNNTAKVGVTLDKGWMTLDVVVISTAKNSVAAHKTRTFQLLNSP